MAVAKTVILFLAHMNGCVWKISQAANVVGIQVADNNVFYITRSESKFGKLHYRRVVHVKPEAGHVDQLLSYSPDRIPDISYSNAGIYQCQSGLILQ
jgi:hypothetical protein